MFYNPETAHREALRALYPLFQLSSEMLAAVNFKGGMETMNPAWEQSFDVSLETGDPPLFSDFFRAEDREKVRKALDAISRGEEIDPFEARAFRRDGAEFLISLRLKTSKMERLCFVAARDVTTSEAVRQAQDDGQRLSELGLFAAVIAHDFNNVLSIIRGSSGILRIMPGLAPAHLRELDDLDGAIRHGAELVQQVFSHGERKETKAGEADLNKVIGQMDWMLRRLGRKNVAVDFLLARDLGRINAEEVQLEQVVLNLAVNARDAMPEGGQLVIETADVRGSEAVPSCEPPLPPGDYVRLSVSDSGHGIPPDVQARLFEPFFSTKKTGTGLGLFSVRRIVQKCGGHIRLDTCPGSGTTFEVYFPRVAAIPLPL